MSSEIRANTLKNRVGLSTINITNTGIVVSGISTFSDKSNFNSNVGIGTDSPYTTGAVSNHKLTIKGDDLLGIGRANTDMFYVRREYAAGKYTLQTINGGNDGSFLLQPFGGKIGIGTNTPADDAYIHIVGPDNGKIILEDNDNNGANLRKNYIGIQGSDNLILAADEADLGTSSSIRFRIDNTEKVRIDNSGRVGIGTENPTARLEIVESKIKTWTPTTQTELLVERAGNCIMSIVGNNDANCQLAFGDSDDENAGYIDYDHADDSMAFRTNGAERVRIKNDGKFGIGLNNPTTNLQIGDGTVDSDNILKLGKRVTSNEGNLPLIGHHCHNGTSSGLGLCATSSSGCIHFFTGNDADGFGNGSNEERFRIAHQGQLGLGGGNYGTAGQVLSSGGPSGAVSWSGGARRILEVVSSPCDGSTVPTSNGDVTFQNVTAQQNLSTSYADVNGSTITYQPPSGTQQVIYEFNMQVTNHDDAISIAHIRFYIDGNEVVYHRRNASGEDIDDFINFKYIINIGGTADANTGRIASWSNAKEMKLTAREYHASNNAISLHTTDHWNGSGTNQFSQPILHITAIGI